MEEKIVLEMSKIGINNLVESVSNLEIMIALLTIGQALVLGFLASIGIGFALYKLGILDKYNNWIGFSGRKAELEGRV